MKQKPNWEVEWQWFPTCRSEPHTWPQLKGPEVIKAKLFLSEKNNSPAKQLVWNAI